MCNLYKLECFTKPDTKIVISEQFLLGEELLTCEQYFKEKGDAIKPILVSGSFTG